MVMPASVIIVGGAVEPELSKPFNENDVLHNDAHASLEHTLAVVEVPEADVRRDPAEICVNVVHKTLKTFRSSAQKHFTSRVHREKIFTVHLPASSGKLVEPVKLRHAHSGGYKRTNCGTR